MKICLLACLFYQKSKVPTHLSLFCPSSFYSDKLYNVNVKTCVFVSNSNKVIQFQLLELSSPRTRSLKSNAYSLFPYMALVVKTFYQSVSYLFCHVVEFFKYKTRQISVEQFGMCHNHIIITNQPKQIVQVC